MIPWAEVIIGGALTYLLWIYWQKRNSKLPPGPPRIPFLGNLHLLGGQPHLSLTKLREKYGDIYSFQFGSYPGVILNGSKVLREALSETATSGRHVPTIAFPCEGGIVRVEGKVLAEQRKFIVKTLKDMGYGKKSIEDMIKQEIVEVLENFQKTVGQPQNFHICFNAAVINSLWVMITGQRFSHKDPRMLNLISLLMVAAQSKTFTFLDGLSFFVTWMRPFQYISTFKRNVRAFMKACFQLFDQVIQEHADSVESKLEGEDFIDMYLKEIRETIDPNSSFYGPEGAKNLRTVLFDLFLAGTETTSSTIVFAMQYLAQNESVQEKLFDEIQLVVGKDRMPSLSDRSNLVYTEAVIYEVLRHSSIVPRAIAHKTMTPYKIQGYEIPADTLIIPNLYSAHHDKATWGDPENFRPERFLSTSADGSVSLIRHHEALLPFSFGKRICLGESLARDQLLLFISSIFQRFRVRPAQSPLKIEYTFTPVVLLPVLKDCILEERY